MSKSLNNDFNNDLNTEPNDDILLGVYGENRPKHSRLKSWGLKIAGGIACSAAVYFFMHIGLVVTILRWTCEIGGRVLGRPPIAVETESRLNDFIDKDLLVSNDPSSPNHPHRTIHDIITKEKKKLEDPPAVNEIKENPVVEKIEEVKKTAETAVAVKATAGQAVTVVKETGEKIAETGGKVVDALQETGGNAKVAVVDTAERLANWREKRREREEKEEREAIEAWAEINHLETDPDWSMPMLRAKALEHKQRLQAMYGPNAMCPHCRFRFRTTTRSGENIRCKRCFAVISARTARSLGSR
jgi:hypothetical protein